MWPQTSECCLSVHVMRAALQPQPQHCSPYAARMHPRQRCTAGVRCIPMTSILRAELSHFNADQTPSATATVTVDNTTASMDTRACALLRRQAERVHPPYVVCFPCHETVRLCARDCLHQKAGPRLVLDLMIVSVTAAHVATDDAMPETS